jgi:alpha-glucosidase
VIPLHQSGAMTTTAARKTPYEILVALAKDGSAQGQLYLDDGEDLRGLDKSTLVEFSVLATPIGSTFTALPAKNAFKDARATAFGKLTVLGISKKPTLVVLNAFTETTAFTFHDKTQCLEVDLTKVKASAGDVLSVYWV